MTAEEFVRMVAQIEPYTDEALRARPELLDDAVEAMNSLIALAQKVPLPL